jgi:hypothetical protein
MERSTAHFPRERPTLYSGIVPLPSSQLSLVKDAIELVVRRLSTLPPSAEVEALREKADEYLRNADGWKVSPQTPEERDRIMKHVLNLHSEVVELSRERAGA